VAVYQDENAGSATDTDIAYGIFTNTGMQAFAHNFVPGGAFGGGAETDPDVAALRDGGFVVVWADADAGAATEIRASIISNGNILVTGNIPVNTTTAGESGSWTA